MTPIFLAGKGFWTAFTAGIKSVSLETMIALLVLVLNSQFKESQSDVYVCLLLLKLCYYL
jgi:hypothetical protein